MKIQLRKPFFPQESIERIQIKVEKILKGGRLTLGKEVELLESKFSKYLDTKYAVSVSSATAGLHLSLLSIGIGREHEVIVPSKTFISTANAAIYCNAKPIFCDVDEKTYQINPLKLKKLISKKTKAIIPVHLGGNVCPMEEILEIANQHNLSIIEDCAHAHGSTYNTKKAGTFGKMGVFSFYPDKIMASADGGIIVTEDESIYEKLLLLRNVGRKKLGQDDFFEIGYNYRMNEIQAAITLEQLRILPKMIQRRREIAKIYDSELREIENLQIPLISPNIKSSYYAYILRLQKGNLEKFLHKLSKRGIETSLMFLSIYRHKAYEKLFGKKNGLCPISERLDKETFTIPLHVGMNDKQVKYVVEEIKKICK